MLRHIDPKISAELLFVLMLMGHGDDLVICDINHPAVTIAKETTYGKLVDLAGCPILDRPKPWPFSTFVRQPDAFDKSFEKLGKSNTVKLGAHAIALIA